MRKLHTIPKFKMKFNKIKSLNFKVKIHTPYKVIT